MSATTIVIIILAILAVSEFGIIMFIVLDKVDGEIQITKDDLKDNYRIVIYDEIESLEFKKLVMLNVVQMDANEPFAK